MCSLPSLPPTRPSPCHPASGWSSPAKDSNSSQIKVSSVTFQEFHSGIGQMYKTVSRSSSSPSRSSSVSSSSPAAPWSCPAPLPAVSTSSPTLPPPPPPCLTSPAEVFVRLFQKRSFLFNFVLSTLTAVTTKKQLLNLDFCNKKGHFFLFSR